MWVCDSAVEQGIVGYGPTVQGSLPFSVRGLPGAKKLERRADVRNRAVELLRTALANPAADFRAGQWECIEGILRNQRQLVVQKTGWGKSMVYFLGTRLLRDQGKGLTLLVSPLLALMRNQIMAANRIGIRAETINFTNADEWDAIEKRLIANRVDVLLISPMRLANDGFRDRILQHIANRVGLFVVDEAH